MVTRMSARGLDLLEQWEGRRLDMYLDSRGLPTIGVGHCLTRDELSSGKVWIGSYGYVRWHEGLTEAQVDGLLDRDNDKAECAVANMVKVDLLQHQFDALVSFAFNAGTGAFAGSTLLRLLNAGRYDQVPAQLRRWVKETVIVDGKPVKRVNKGLASRRENEIALWEGRL